MQEFSLSDREIYLNICRALDLSHLCLWIMISYRLTQSGPTFLHRTQFFRSEAGSNHPSSLPRIGTRPPVLTRPQAINFSLD